MASAVVAAAAAAGVLLRALLAPQLPAPELAAEGRVRALLLPLLVPPEAPLAWVQRPRTQTGSGFARHPCAPPADTCLGPASTCGAGQRQAGCNLAFGETTGGNRQCRTEEADHKQREQHWPPPLQGAAVHSSSPSRIPAHQVCVVRAQRVLVLHAAGQQAAQALAQRAVPPAVGGQAEGEGHVGLAGEVDALAKHVACGQGVCVVGRQERCGVDWRARGRLQDRHPASKGLRVAWLPPIGHQSRARATAATWRTLPGLRPSPVRSRRVPEALSRPWCRMECMLSIEVPWNASTRCPLPSTRSRGSSLSCSTA